MKETLLQLVKTAGAASEDDTERDGFLSYAGETHALGTGLGVGFVAMATGRTRLLGLLLVAVLYGRQGKTALSPRLFRQLVEELPYFAVGLALGGGFGLLARPVVV